jgi:hypothetical protein
MKNAQNFPFSKQFKGFQGMIFQLGFPSIADLPKRLSRAVKASPTKSNLVQPNPTTPFPRMFKVQGSKFPHRREILAS